MKYSLQVWQLQSTDSGVNILLATESEISKLQHCLRELLWGELHGLHSGLSSEHGLLHSMCSGIYLNHQTLTEGFGALLGFFPPLIAALHSMQGFPFHIKNC